MIGVKLFLYDSNEEANGYRGEELSQYILSGAQNKENLTEELDITEITLQGIDRSAEYEPETKFIIDIYEGDTRMATYHRIVQEDVVEKPILSDNEYFKHSITFIEPSAIAQKRIVDNIAITYKLKDVNLDERPAFSLDEKSVMGLNSTAPTPSRGFANYVDSTNWSDTRNTSFGKYFLWKKTDNSATILLKYEAELIGTLTQDHAPTSAELSSFVQTQEGRTPQSGDLVIAVETLAGGQRYYKYLYNGQAWKGYETAFSDNDNSYLSDFYYTDINGIKPNAGDGKRYAQFVLPAPHIMWGVKDTYHRPPHLLSPAYDNIGIASFICTITETAPNGAQRVVSQSFISSSNLGTSHDTDFPYNFAVQSYPTGKSNFVAEYLLEKETVRFGKETGPGSGNLDRHDFNFYFAKYTDRANGTNYTSQDAITAPIDVKVDCTYSVELKVLNLATAEQGVPIVFYPHGNTIFYYNALVYQDSGFRGFCYIKDKTGLSPYAQNVLDSADALPLKNFAPDTSFYFYKSDGGTIMLAQGIEYSALNLIKKAIINSNIYFKPTNGNSSVDFEHENDYPFYISHRDEVEGDIVTSEDLATIRVNETFFRQKNLWEILLEVGKYAHAIPQITFGKDDKFAISFYKLGGTNLLYSDNTRCSIMNFRKIDDYVSACSSYIDNLVQLGGQIKEIVAPKTTHEQYLVYNDTAEIVTSKPIIELLSVNAIATKSYTFTNGVDTRVVAVGDSIDITNYIFEKNVYNLLGIVYTDVPNKGIGLYYELGTNVIKGGDYQLPFATPNPYSDYAFKKAIFSAALSTDPNFPYGGYPTGLSTVGGTGPWYNIKINDFVFEVVYRTKDTARIEHTRPDLRHYLLSSKYDNVPTHKQFNNQQDILVDSVAFGGSMFGKLIRTGNSNYKVREWCNSLATIKHKGELYNIELERYYVAKATHIFFPDHIESIIEYSKDYNQLSEIIGIPSEPRFYEISEQSSIDREVSINDYLLVTTDQQKIDGSAPFVADFSHTKDLIFALGATFLKWAKTTFSGDDKMDSVDYGTFGLYPFEKKTLSPVNAYSCGNTLTYEWDMVDNLSAGDKILSEDNTDPDDPINPASDKTYRPMRAVQYPDVYGKATLLDFNLYGDIDLNFSEIRAIPEAPTLQDETPIVRTTKSIVLLKDCREVLHFNYNLMQITDSDRFVLSPFFFTEKKKHIINGVEQYVGVKVVLLDTEVNKMSNGYVIINAELASNNSPTITVSGGKITIDMSWISALSYDIQSKVKSIVIMENDQQSGSMQQFIIAKNVAQYELSNNWYFGAPNKDNLFTRKQ